jgi:hypothetical protein
VTLRTAEKGESIIAYMLVQLASTTFLGELKDRCPDTYPGAPFVPVVRDMFSI